MTKYPSWEDVGIPLLLVNSIKTLPPCYMLDSLVHQLAFRGKRRPQYVYRCDRCGNQWRPERNSEEVTSCPKCGSYQVCCTPQLRFGKEIPSYTKRIHHLNEVIRNVLINYVSYFKVEPPEKLVDVGWGELNVYAQFLGGERVVEISPKLCLYRAVILCPYLWDNSFDWTEDSRTDTLNVEHICPILHNFCHPQWIMGGRPE